MFFNDNDFDFSEPNNPPQNTRYSIITKKNLTSNSCSYLITPHTKTDLINIDQIISQANANSDLNSNVNPTSKISNPGFRFDEIFNNNNRSDDKKNNSSNTLIQINNSKS